MFGFRIFRFAILSKALKEVGKIILSERLGLKPMWSLTFFENSNLEKAWKRRVLFDKFLALFLCLAMAGFLTGKLAHEALGLILTLALIRTLLSIAFGVNVKSKRFLGQGQGTYGQKTMFFSH